MHPPRATYRLQFSRDFGFAAAARIAPYLARLGVSHVYASPYLRARPGSTHGYDIVAHDELNPELGDAAAFAAMNEAFARHGLKQILDFVPNHMGVGGADNPLWLEVLEWGPHSPFSGWFDIDWEPAARYLTEKLLVPVLGQQYGAALEDGKLVLKYDAAAGELAVWAYDAHKLPICPLHYARVLGTEHAGLERLGDEFSALPEWRPQIERRADELKRELAFLVETDAEARASLERSLAALNGASDPTRRALDDLIQQQYWRASHFRVAGDDINYRRFFNINDLAGLRVELPDVFEHVHRLAAQLLRSGVIDGLRIDHIDGLLDPTGYLERLRSLALRPDAASRPFYLVVEKILAREERLPEEWRVEGTTGYEFANLLTRLFMDPAGEQPLTHCYVEWTGVRASFATMVRDCKLQIMRNEMSSELNVLARDAARVARQNGRTADFTRNILRRAIRAAVACFPVYRTYLNSSGRLSDDDRQRILRALADARRLERDADPSVFDFLEHLLTGALASAPRSGFSRHAALRCAMKFQQYSGPVMAKGLEDTAFYRYNRCIALNEVGGDPERFSESLEQFHAANRERAQRLPHSLLGTSTHDTKRGEDARARLAVLSEIPDEWRDAVRGWRALLGKQGITLEDANLEYFFHQTLVGAWPPEGVDDAFRARVHDAMRKAAREARAHTSWSAPNTAYEEALERFIDGALRNAAFIEAFTQFHAQVAEAGARNGLVQTVLKLTVPGVPDLYQGSELWDLSLVDPDNRRPVDFERRERMLDALLDAWRRDPLETVRHAWRARSDGGVKLLATALVLAHRRAHEALFRDGAYVACETGDDTLGAFLRTHAGEKLLVVFRRHTLRQAAGAAAGGSRLAALAQVSRNLLTGEPVRGDDARALLDVLPVAVCA
jgi:(1->4)-alpha-D-glucan 1-alpha-D-glucosylmutase